MERYRVVGEVPKLGKVQHNIKAATRGEAWERYERAQPAVLKCVSCHTVPEWLAERDRESALGRR